MDFLFIKKYMPDLASIFSHVLVDVSSVKALCIRWYPRDQKKALVKENKHRAMDDIRESIEELKCYKESIFKAKFKRSVGSFVGRCHIFHATYHICHCDEESGSS